MTLNVLEMTSYSAEIKYIFRNSSQMSTKSANSSTTNSTDDLTMDSNYNIDTDSTGAERILKLLP